MRDSAAQHPEGVEGLKTATGSAGGNSHLWGMMATSKTHQQLIARFFPKLFWLSGPREFIIAEALNNHREYKKVLNVLKSTIKNIINFVSVRISRIIVFNSKENKKIGHDIILDDVFVHHRIEIVYLSKS